MELLWEVAGWSGAVAILSAYLAVSMGWIKAGRAFQTANLLGACAFVVNGAVHHAWPSVATNVAWFVISAVSLLRMHPPRRVPVVHCESPATCRGIDHTTGQLAVVSVLTASVPREADDR